jgi:hypothetical protein
MNQHMYVCINVCTVCIFPALCMHMYVCMYVCMYENSASDLGLLLAVYGIFSVYGRGVRLHLLLERLLLGEIRRCMYERSIEPTNR